MSHHNPSQQARERDIFLQALDKPNPHERAAFVDEVCGSDRLLRQRVNALLDAGSQSGSFLENPATLIKAPAAEARVRSLPREFPAGTLWAGRYRIVGLLAEGGMGRVYRADDLKLGQSVALKFLSHALARDVPSLLRLRHEVRIAREIAHPNVCRVYDIGEAEGEHFISMEFIDGEDLACLLRRIGRFPEDKAIEIARQICAGLAAAHDRGVLHRDLKPANIMIDGRGKVRITDFGIAAMAHEIKAEEAGAGTPSYMAPEQLAASEVTLRSDIYSLGLVLYEIFTGKRAIDADSITQIQRAHGQGTPRTPSSHIKDLDPQVERIILDCLAKDPAKRPRSAIAVAAALPGADLLAAALAAGEIPSPDLVAEAHDTGIMSPAVALSCAGAALLLLAALVWVKDQLSLFRWAPLERSPQVMVDRAQQIAGTFGYFGRPTDVAYWFRANTPIMETVSKTTNWHQRLRALGWNRAAPVLFFYRTSPQPLRPLRDPAKVTWSDPPFTFPGMVRMQMDAKGRLLAFHTVPRPFDKATSSSSKPDWSAFFAQADLDQSRFAEVPPEWTPPVHCDERLAWKGPHPSRTNRSIRVEAGSFAGKPVFFEVVLDTVTPDRAFASPALSEIPIGQLIGEVCGCRPKRGATPPAQRIRAGQLIAEIPWSVTPILVVLAGAWMARRHVLAGRGDLRGARRLSFVVFAAFILQAIFALPNWNWEASWRVLGSASAKALIGWLIYVALEPYARAFWPRTLISWNRLIAGRIADRLVARDILVGCVLGLAASIANHLHHFQGSWPAPAVPVIPGSADILLGSSQAFATVFEALADMGLFIGFFLLLVLFRISFRRTSIAITAFAILLMLALTDAFTQPYVHWIASLFMVALVLLALFRFGLLALVMLGLTGKLMQEFPATLDFSTWYSASVNLGPILIAAVALLCCRIALSAPPTRPGGLQPG